MLKILEKLANSQIKWRHSGYLCCCFTSLILLSACSSAPHTPAPIRNINIQNNQLQPVATQSLTPPTQANWGYSASSQQYAAVKSPAVTPPPAPPQPAENSFSWNTYRVKAGDTLYHIATTHGISYQALAKQNKITAPYQLLVGETLQVPVKSNVNTTVSQAVSTPIATSERDYDTIPKGQYTAKKYTVKQGDTLYYIAWISDTSYQELAALNHIVAPYSLKVGEVLQLPNSEVSSSQVASPVVPPISTTSSHVTNNSTIMAKPSNTQPVVKSVTPTPIKTVVTPVVNRTITTKSTMRSSRQSKQTDGIQWQWPAQGNIIQTFTNSNSDSKGIDISGKKGQPIYAAANGKVVYAGDALKGYGNLIIIKHNDDYLTAYAHNDTMLVKEGQDVQRGQQIATMGSTGTTQVELHFEIRYKGKAVDPQSYLPN